MSKATPNSPPPGPKPKGTRFTPPAELVKIKPPSLKEVSEYPLNSGIPGPPRLLVTVIVPDSTSNAFWTQGSWKQIIKPTRVPEASMYVPAEFGVEINVKVTESAFALLLTPKEAASTINAIASLFTCPPNDGYYRQSVTNVG
jgi:hypothetical protein